MGTIDDSTQRVNAGVGVPESSDLTSGQRDVTLHRDVTVVLRTGRGSHSTGSTLDNLPKYAFAVPPIDSASELAHYPGLSRSVTQSANETRDLYTIDQWGTYRIDQVSIKGINGNEFDGNTTMDSTTASFDEVDKYVIPDSAFTTRVNVPPPSEIIVTSSGTRFSSSNVEFDDNVRTFDTA